MMTTIILFLYGKPSLDMDIEGKTYINPNIFRKRGEELKEHLRSVADSLEKLQAAGWKVSEGYGAIYALELYKEITKTEAKKELKRLKISLEQVSLDEYEDEGESDEEAVL